MENYPAVCLIVSSQDANLHPENRLLHMAMYTATLKSTVLCYAINNTPATASCNLKLKFKVMVHSSQLTIGTGSLPCMCMLTLVTSGRFWQFICLPVKITQTGNIDSFGASSTWQSQQLQHMCMVFREHSVIHCVSTTNSVLHCCSEMAVYWLPLCDYWPNVQR